MHRSLPGLLLFVIGVCAVLQVDGQDMVESCGMWCGYGPVVEGGLDPFYKKAIDVRGFPIASAKDVSDVALFQAGLMLDLMVMKRPDLLDLLVKGGDRLAIMGHTFLSDSPEWWLVRLIPIEWFGFRPWDEFAGNGAFNGWFPQTCPEEDLLCSKIPRYGFVCLHEFAHRYFGFCCF